MHRGYIPLWRKFKDTKFWQEKRVFSKWEAWEDIITEARHEKEPEQILIGLKLVECKRGQCLKSLGTWGKRWRWTRSKVRRYFELLKLMKMICTESVSKTTRLTVCNYELYNDLRPLRDHFATTSRPQLNNVNNEKNVKNKDLKDLKDLKEKRKKETPMILPDGLDPELWSEWLQHRKEKKNALTPTAMQRQLKKLAKLEKPNEALRHSLEQGYSGIFEPKSNGKAEEAPCRMQVFKRS